MRTGFLNLRPTSRSGVLRIVLLGMLGVIGAGPRPALTAPLPPSPDRPWTPPPELKPPPLPVPQSPGVTPEMAAKGITVSLPQIVDIALRNSPVTRDTWMAARAAAAEMGSRRANYYPQFELDAVGQRQKVAAVGGQFTILQTTYSPSLNLTWLLFNFGGTQADVEDARQLLLAADWEHNAAIQDVVLRVTQAYYQYLGEAALVEAFQSSLAQAQTNLDAADARHHAGLATIADVLQARTLLSQEKLGLTEVEGRMKAVKGALATAMGLPPDLPVTVGALPAEVSARVTTEEAGTMLARALGERPDLLAARAKAAAAQAHAKKVRAEGLPALVLSGGANRVYYDPALARPYSDNYSIQLGLRFPLFTGFRNHFDTLQAEAEAGSAQAQVEFLRNQVMLQVWTSYYDLQTAAQQVQTSRDLLESATQSVEVAHGRYKDGVGNILDLLTAQSAAAGARAQEVQARAGWFLALTQLAHDTGVLGPAEPREGEK